MLAIQSIATGGGLACRGPCGVDVAIKKTKAGGASAYIEAVTSKYVTSPLLQKLHKQVGTLYGA